MLTRFLHTDSNNTSLLFQRVVLGAVILPHGAQKLLGWFGGYGFESTMNFFTGTMGIPAPIAALVIIGESLGALALMLGLATRFAAFGVSTIMLGAIITTHLKVGFFMNWFGNQQGEGFEFHLLALALSLPLSIQGAGRFAVDSRLGQMLKQPAVRAQIA